MTYDLQKPQPTVIRTPVSDVVDAVRFEGLSLRLAAIESGRTRDQMKALCWRAAKDDTFKRDNRRCVQCGDYGHDAHHRLPRQAGGTARPLIAFGLANLVTLCRSCHDYTETTGRITGWSYDNGYVLRQGTEPTTVPVQLLERGWVLLGNRGEITRTTPPTDDSERSAA